MTLLSDFIDKMPELLSVDDSYKTTQIPLLVDNAMRKLLRDYNFPKSLVRLPFPITLGEVEYTLPVGFKKAIAVVFEDTALNTGLKSYSNPLLKRSGIVAHSGAAYPEYYWLEGLKLRLNVAQSETSATTKLLLFYQSISLVDNVNWLLTDYPDVVLSLSMYRAASIMRKPELAQAWGPLWAEDQKGLAIFLNELEFDNMEIMMHEARPARSNRYPSQTY